MPIDVSRLLSPEARAREARIRNEIHRLHALPDRFLGRALRDLAREARREAPERLEAGCEGLLIRSAIPRLAKTLGETELTPSEARFLLETPPGGRDLRDFVGACLANHDLLRIGLQVDGEALQILGRDFVNGNPIAIALDRVAPPDPDSDDWVARHMREVSRVRFGSPRFDAWTPAFQEWRDDVETAETFEAPSP